ncbi:MAG: hypothetical protein GY801_34840 [bacterium]|nr:hypothetical protein [bacterium]
MVLELQELCPESWKLRKAIRIVNQTLNELRVEHIERSSRPISPLYTMTHP